MFNFGNLIVVVPLIVVFTRLAPLGGKALNADPKDMARARAVGKALLFIGVAVILMWRFVPPLGGAEVIIGAVITTVCAILGYYAVVDFPALTPSSGATGGKIKKKVSAFMDKVDDLAWRDGWKNPWRRSGDPIPFIRWGRRFAFVLFGLFILTVAVIGAPTGGASTSQASHPDSGSTSSTSAPAVTSSATPSATTTSQAPVTTTNTAAPSSVVIITTTAQPQPFSSTCQPGPDSIPRVAVPIEKPFGPGNMQLCYNGKWQSWDAVNPASSAPKSVLLEGYVHPDDSSYAYAYIQTSNGEEYPMRTTDF